MTVAVKICGTRSPAAAIAAAEAGADFVGLIFAPSRRQITVEQGQAIVAALRAHPQGGGVQTVGVFVDASPAEISAVAAAVGLDWAQLSGHERAADFQDFALPVLKAVRLAGDAGEDAWLGIAGCDAAPVVVDAHVAGSFGGAGVVGDWQRAAALAAARPILLAGGLNPENVASAVAAVRPWGVDVSSGVETAGEQDCAKIRAFVSAAKQAAAVGGQHKEHP